MNIQNPETTLNFSIRNQQKSRYQDSKNQYEHRKEKYHSEKETCRIWRSEKSPIMTLDYTLIRSFRRTLSLQISREGSLIVRAPRLMPVFLIEKFITEKTAWIEKNQEKVRSKIREKTSYTDEEIQEMKKRLREYILPRVEELWGEQNLQKYTSIKITKSE